ncbi:poly-gamma-glutamate synthesis protein (capsule biosynthesis protein) [Pedococcus dokdonensis]|uniref:Poly-gamma-glutamate synthesis protein (Capsule biosynthesis protein) n=1 Tax=Pedococcus dokdonensis TaxID=443156 RepID=A0A1H0NBA2_9MICO|nr:CapA family protein [Pedococcus dokdonensis]SDO90034.1 poly-gamma-glutamate synthesis protein (capsule biosynthesis protein) [Pedococcus dokdonensis]
MRPLTPAVAAAAVVPALVLALAGCQDAAPSASPTTSGVGPTSTTTGAPTTTGPSTTGPSTTTTTATSAPSDPDTLTMAFAGDVHFEDYVAPLARDPHGLDELQTSLGVADLAMVNLETAITQRGTKIGKEFHFRAPASALVTIKNAGIDAVSMANNHGVDYGPVGLQDTLAAKKTSPIPIVGIGKDEDEAFAPAILEAKGLEVAVFGASEVFEMTLARYSAGPGKGGIASASPITRLRNAVSKAAAKYDVVVVFLHWGLDYQKCADPLSVQTAQALEQAGADIIVGGHSHRVNGGGWLGRSYVDYGFGNFVWWRSHEPDSRSGVLTVSVDVKAAKGTRRSTRSVVRKGVWTPMLVGADGIPREPGAADSARLLALWKQAATCSGLAAKPE